MTEEIPEIETVDMSGDIRLRACPGYGSGENRFIKKRFFVEIAPGSGLGKLIERLQSVCLNAVVC